MMIRECNQLIIEAYAHRTSKDIVRKKEETKYNSIIKQYKIV